MGPCLRPFEGLSKASKGLSKGLSKASKDVSKASKGLSKTSKGLSKAYKGLSEGHSRGTEEWNYPLFYGTLQNGRTELPLILQNLDPYQGHCPKKCWQVNFEAHQSFWQADQCEQVSLGPLSQKKKRKKKLNRH